MKKLILFLWATQFVFSQITQIPPPTSGGGGGGVTLIAGQDIAISGTLPNQTITNLAGYNVFNVDNSNFAGGADPTGATDSTAAINAAQTACHANGGGTVLFPGHLYLYTTGTIYDNCVWVGGGKDSTMVLQAPGTNADMLKTALGGYAGGVKVKYAASAGSGNATANKGFGIHRMTVDGNADNQTSGSGKAVTGYAYGYMMSDVTFQHFRGDCLYLDYNGAFPAETTPTIAVRMVNVSTNHCGVSNDKGTVYTAGAVGARIAGPTDQQWTNFVTSENAAEGLIFGPNAGAYQINGLHSWGSTTGVNAPSVLFESGGSIVNGEAEGSDTVQIAVLGSAPVQYNGFVFQPTTVPFSTPGIQIGQLASVDPFPGSFYQTTPGALVPSAGTSTASQNVGSDFKVLANNTPGGALNFVNEQNTNADSMTILLSDAGSYVGGTPAPSSNYNIRGTGRTCNSTLARCGGKKSVADPASTRFNVLGDGSNDLVNFNFNTKTLELNNGWGTQYYSGFYSGQTYATNEHSHGFDYNGGETFLDRSAAGLWQMNGGLITAVSPTQATASSGTITILNSSKYWGTIPVNPSGNITGVILAAGTAAGQNLSIHNRSAFSITFAASGTSNVSNGVNCTIPAGSEIPFQWNTSDSLWYGSCFPALAASAFVDTTNAANITTGYLPYSQTPAGFPFTDPNTNAFDSTFSFNTKLTNILILGDSVAECAGFTIYANCWVPKITRDMQTLMGDGGSGYRAIHDSSGMWTLAGGNFTTISGIGPYESVGNVTNTAYQNIDTTSTATSANWYGDHFKVYWAENSGTASGCTIAFDGGGTTTFANASQTNLTAGSTSFAVTAGWHTAVIKGVANTSCIILGGEAIIGTTGIRVHDFGRGGMNSYAIGADTANQLAMALQITGGVQQVIILDGINDAVASISTSTYQTNLQNVITWLQSNFTPPPTILIMDEENTSAGGGTTPTQAQIRATVKALVAANTGVEYISIADRFGTYASANAKGLMNADTIHPSDQGQLSIAHMVMNRFGLPFVRQNMLIDTGTRNWYEGNVPVNFSQGTSSGTQNMCFGLGLAGGSGAFANTGNTTCFGYQALGGLTTGIGDTAVGRFSCGSVTTGSNDVCVGNNADISATVSGSFEAAGGTCTVANSFCFKGVALFNTSGALTNVATVSTLTNCASAAGTCVAAPAGSVSVAAAATTVVVATTVVTANSIIIVTFDSSLGTKLSVTCNTTEPALFGVTARTAGTSFTITSSAPVTNPACFNYFIVN